MANRKKKRSTNRKQHKEKKTVMNYDDCVEGLAAVFHAYVDLYGNSIELKTGDMPEQAMSALLSRIDRDNSQYSEFDLKDIMRRYRQQKLSFDEDLITRRDIGICVKFCSELLTPAEQAVYMRRLKLVPVHAPDTTFSEFRKLKAAAMTCLDRIIAATPKVISTPDESREACSND